MGKSLEETEEMRVAQKTRKEAPGVERGHRAGENRVRKEGTRQRAIGKADASGEKFSAEVAGIQEAGTFVCKRCKQRCLESGMSSENGVCFRDQEAYEALAQRWKTDTNLKVW